MRIYEQLRSPRPWLGPPWPAPTSSLPATTRRSPSQLAADATPLVPPPSSPEKPAKPCDAPLPWRTCRTCRTETCHFRRSEHATSPNADNRENHNFAFVVHQRQRLRHIYRVRRNTRTCPNPAIQWSASRCTYFSKAPASPANNAIPGASSRYASHSRCWLIPSRS